MLAATLLGIVILAAARRVMFTGPIAAPEEIPVDNIVDMHCHTAGIGAGDTSDCFVSNELRRSWRFGHYLKTFAVTESELHEHGDVYILTKISEAIAQSQYVAAAVVLAMDGVVGPDGVLDKPNTEFYVGNRYVGNAVKAFDNLYFGASVNPFRSNALNELDWSAANGAKLLKWLPSIQDIDPADERITPFYEKLVALKLPLLTHVGDEASFTRAQDHLADPKRLRLPLEIGVTVIAAHAATSGKNEGQENVERLATLFAEFPNLYADISTLTQINRRRYLKTVLHDSRFKGRLLYGTDHPLTNTPLVTPWQYPLNLTIAQMVSASRIQNSWDRDVTLKHLLGFPAGIFTAPSAVLNLSL